MQKFCFGSIPIWSTLIMCRQWFFCSFLSTCFFLLLFIVQKYELSVLVTSRYVLSLFDYCQVSKVYYQPSVWELIFLKLRKLFCIWCKRLLLMLPFFIWLCLTCSLRGNENELINNVCYYPIGYIINTILQMFDDKNNICNFWK